MGLFITILIVLASIVLVFIVLIQNSKGGGLASGFASSNQVMGVRKTTDFLEKATWFLAGTVLLLSIVVSSFTKHDKPIAKDSMIKEQIENATTVDPNVVAPFGTPAPVAPDGKEAPATQAPAPAPAAPENNGGNK